MSFVSPDQPARDRIQTDLTTNLLVEAGAGSGKTTALVSRLLQHVITGTPVEQLAAVTFTRKAADELRERFQLQLEQVVRDGAADATPHSRCVVALRDLERAFLGTIHSFCARLLRERPIEVGLDPDFEEIADIDEEPMTRAFWREWIDESRRLDDPDVRALYECGLDPSDLHTAFARTKIFHDVEFASMSVAMPEVGNTMSRLDALLDRALAMIPAPMHEDGPDRLMLLAQRLRFHRSVSDWSDAVTSCALLESLTTSQMAVIQKRWSSDKAGKTNPAKLLSDDLVAFLTDVATPVIQQWREYRYPIVMRVLQKAVAQFAARRHANGTLGFDDLLLLCARLLRENPAVRDELGERYRYLLVDEFQDTDPVQAEVCLLLASESRSGNDWQSVTPRAGALFVVGDPKQSIYRFRRADILIYERVRQRFEQFGATLALTSNFRSTKAIGAFVNTHFESVFPVESSGVQAAFSPLIAAKGASVVPTAGIMRYTLRYTSGGAPAVVDADAALVSAWIADRIGAGEAPGNFLVLTYRKDHIASYARALAERNVAVSTTGANLTQEHELREIMVVLRALADPGNPVLVVAALEGLFFGLSAADLFAARREDIAFSISAPVVGDVLPVARALAVLRRWFMLSRLQPADVLLEHIFDETGLLYLAAGSVLGDARTGTLLHIVESVRAESATGRSGLTDAIGMLDALLDGDSPDAPLRPGRSDAVRVMNLHKAKGLEAEIVILAAPTDRNEHEPEVHVTRSAQGSATGGILITRGSGKQKQRLAQPVGWDAMQATETQFQRAEEERLRYVATTRAKRALVVAQAEKMGNTVRPDSSMWRPLAATLEQMSGVPLTIVVGAAAGRERLMTQVSALATRAAAAAARVADARAPSLIVETVTGTVKGDNAFAEPLPRASRDTGRAWGSAVHRCIDAMVRGRAGDSLRLFVRAVLDDEGVAASACDRMMQLLDMVVQSPTWETLRTTGVARSELAVMRAERVGDRVIVTEGVIDVAVDDGTAWRVIDWKSDHADDDAWAARLERYTDQVNGYATLLQAITYRPAAASIERVGQS
jgi:ATP-dependent helicase/nuclease subunit A